MNELFSFLKQHTLSAHQALEAHYPFNHMMQTSQFREQEYAAMLQVLLAFHHFAPQWIVALPAAKRDMLQIERVSDALIQDLQQLNATKDIVPHAFIAPAVMATAEERALAAAYVWMGSSLGGKMIERWLRLEFPAFPRAYYTQMKEVSKQWPTFIQSVNTQRNYSKTQMAQVADTANALFTGLQDTATTLNGNTIMVES